MNQSPGSLEQLSNRIDDLERRLQALEHSDESKAVPSASHPITEAFVVGLGSDLQTGNVFPVLGRAMLGIAGAYLLRAATTEGAAPALLVSAIAVAYAFAWLVWALRKSQALSRYVYAGTSVLILAPMLWEVTLHFNVLTPMMTAGVLAGFLTLATLLELPIGNKGTAWIVHPAMVLMVASLAFATRDVLPFLFTLLIAVFVIEYQRVRGYPEPAWPVIALLTDVTIWGTIFIYSGPQTARTGYAELPVASLVSPACLLLAIQGTSSALRVWIHKSRVGIFEAIQLLIAFSLAMASLLYFVPVRGEMMAGVTCLALAAAIYPAAFIRLERLADRRNFHVFGTWSAALLVVGALWTMPHEASPLLLAVAGCAAYFVATRINSMALELHGAVFLSLGAATSEMPRYVFGVLAGSLPGRPAISVFIISIAAAIAFAGDRESGESAGARKVLQFVPPLIALCGACALLTHGALAMSALVLVPEAHHVAFLRTLTVSFSSLCLAFAGSRWGLAAMTRLAYVALSFVAAKLLFEDLRHGHMAYVAGSILLFAISLMVVPLLIRWGARLRASHHRELMVASKS